MILSILIFVFLSVFSNALPIGQRERRYAFYKYKWNKCTLTYRFHDPYNLFKNASDYQIARQTISKAFNVWQRGSNQRLKFIDLSEKQFEEDELVNIDVSFARKNHGCVEELDGPGNIVAHSAYLPYGLIHLNADEQWNIDGIDGSGPDLRYVLLHELGHVLGLRHSEDKASVMSQYYKNRQQRDFNLSADDIRAIRNLYNHC